MNKKRQLDILYTNIGRGHPYYLDGVVEIIRKKYGDRFRLNVIDVFELSSGLTLILWRLVRWLYRAGSQGGIIGRLYYAIRHGRRSKRPGILEKQLARFIREYIKKNKYPTLVAHPILVPMLTDLVDVYYQHGEIAVPDEAIVQNAHYIFIPTIESKEKFIKAGLPEEKIIVSGLCLEPELVEKSQEYFEKRTERIKAGQPLCGGFFSSGAEPKQHIDKIMQAVESIKKSQGQALVFCRKNGQLYKAMVSRFKIRVITNIYQADNIDNLLQSENILAVAYKNRKEENDCIVHLFEYLDYFVAPSHERTNWAVGLGLPMFILHPIIGTFSPLNRVFLLEQGVAIDLDSENKAKNFSELLNQKLKDGSLYSMAQNGFGKFELNGFDMVAEFLKEELT
jgi:hypothetical protein